MTLMNLPDGRTLDIRIGGPAAGPVLLFHHGTPGSAAPFRFITTAARALGMRTITYSRPGYGDSTRHVGRTVADVVPDLLHVLDRLGIQDCVTAGWSGGGPHALACGVLAPDRVRGVLTIAGVAPYDAPGLNFLDGMGEENVEEFGATVAGEHAWRAAMGDDIEQLAHATAQNIVAGMSTLLPESDLAVLSDEFGQDLAAGFREGLRNGADGWLDDDLTFVRPWGFDLSKIEVPTHVWQGSEDLMVPAAHGRWLAQAIPGVAAHLLQGEGHLSVVIGSIDAMLADLIGE